MGDLVCGRVEIDRGNLERIEFRVKQKLCERVVSATMSGIGMRPVQRRHGQLAEGPSRVRTYRTQAVDCD